MTEEITREVFAHLVELAALQLDEAEAEYLRGQLNQQLNAIHQLRAVVVEGDAAPMSHGIPYDQSMRQELREDLKSARSDGSLLLGQAPQVADGWIVVPEIPASDLE